MEAIKVKPCPFCGGEAYVGGNGPYRINCKQCSAFLGPIYTVDQSDAISRWNARFAPKGQFLDPKTSHETRGLDPEALDAALLAFDGISDSTPPAKARRRRHVSAAITAYLSAIEPVEATVEPVAADYFAAFSPTGMHIGLWESRVVAEEMVADMPGSTIIPLKLASPPSPQGRGEIIEECAGIVDEVDKAATDMAKALNLDGNEDRRRHELLVAIARDIRSLTSPSGDKIDG